MIVYLNGEWLDADAARIPADDRGFLYADGVFETARLHRGAWFRFEEHMIRLAAGAAEFRLEAPPADELRRVADGLRDRNAIPDGSFRVTLTRGREGGGAPTVLATLRPVPGDWRERAARGWSLVTARIRHPEASTMPAHVKALGRPHGLIARHEAAAAGADDALLLSTDGIVAEGPTWNVFWRGGDVLRTPSLDVGILDGVTRRAILELAPALGLAVEEGAWQREELDRADEIFATMSSSGVVPIRSLDRRAVPADPAFAPHLFARYWALVEAEAAP